MKFGQLIESTIDVFFFKNHAENEARRIVLDLFSFVWKTYEVKANGLELSFNILMVLNLVCDKNKMYKGLD